MSRPRRGSSRGLSLQAGIGALGRLLKGVGQLTEPAPLWRRTQSLLGGRPRNRCIDFPIRARSRKNGCWVSAFAHFTLEEARERARPHPAREKVVEPARSRKAEKARRALEAARNKPYEECAEACFNDDSPAWKSAVHRQDWSDAATLAFRTRGAAGRAVDAGLGAARAQPLWLARTKTAKMLRQRSEEILSSARPMAIGTARTEPG